MSTPPNFDPSDTLIRVPTAVLDIACEASGPPDGRPVILLHGFPYSPRAYDDVVPPLAAAGCRVLVPYLRGYGSTSFLSPQTLRSGQQAALGKDLLDFMDALRIPKALLVGFDWGGRAACIVAALWPERAAGLVSIGGYNIQNIPAAANPAAPEQEHRLWYQYYFHTRRGQTGLTVNTADLCRLLWRLWSPTWNFAEETFARSAAAFDNPDFVAVVIQSYRHRFDYAAGDPALEDIEIRLAAQPTIGVPTIVLDGADDGVTPVSPTDTAAAHFSGPYSRRVIPRAGHNLPQEKPAAVVAAILELLGNA
ncbi:MAG: alpha/beta hydrolase [Chloroflexota bacterium]|nr:alpha/beta hydrolase [Chloroflexota bacterium]